MPEPFKNVFSLTAIEEMAGHLSKACSTFDTSSFVAVASKSLDSLEMKQRSEQIISALEVYMPEDFEVSAKSYLKSLSSREDAAGLGIKEAREKADGIEGWLIAPIAEYVGRHGFEHFELSMELFTALTKRFSAEFGIRHFIVKDQSKTLTYLKTYINDPSEHVRRLISEGTRPLLPWGIQLKALKADPTPLFEILDLLIDDPSAYVRRSVANSLNDIAKDHPDRVAELVSNWLIDAPQKRQQLLRHASRTLLKQGHTQSLKNFGYDKPCVDALCLSLDKPILKMGETLSIEFSFKSTSEQRLMIDYIVYHQKANGKLTPKVFKWKQLDAKNNQALSLKKQHSFKPVTTRKYYEGAHRIEMLINGELVESRGFELTS